jgi:hypothetical protein
MTSRFKSLFTITLLALSLLPVSACAQITVAFYSHELDRRFLPHAFIELKGAPQAGGPSVDVNFGFTAQSVTPAVLMGPVFGKIEAADAAYVRHSDRKFAFAISDQQFGQLMALVEKWRALPGKSYDLNHRNCVHFVGEAAQILGLKVVFEKSLIKRPRGFLENIVRLNPMLANR